VPADYRDAPPSVANTVPTELLFFKPPTAIMSRGRSVRPRGDWRVDFEGRARHHR
jgi:hypothetical protein